MTEITATQKRGSPVSLKNQPINPENAIREFTYSRDPQPPHCPLIGGDLTYPLDKENHFLGN